MMYICGKYAVFIRTVGFRKWKVVTWSLLKIFWFLDNTYQVILTWHFKFYIDLLQTL
jgi:hypothetical protein